MPPRPCPKHSGTQGHGFIISDGPQRSPGAIFPPSLFRQKPLQPQVCYSLSTLCSFVWGGGMGWDGMVVCVGGVDSQGWETHVTVALRVFVIGTACLVRLRGHSQLLGCSTVMRPEPISLEQPWPHKQDASDVQLHKCGRQIPVQHFISLSES